ncbi:B3/B4 domain-containing protein [Levilactobacillus spicheri]
MTQKFIVDPEFWDIFPDVQIAFLTAHGVDNHSYGDLKKSRLAEANEKAEDWVPYSPISKTPIIAAWREAFSKFKTKKGARCAVEALLKRASKGNGVGAINPVVDLYNTVSLTYAFPLAAEDMDKIVGDVHLGVAKGGEPFFPIGEAGEEPEEALPGEVIYRDDQGVISRCWAWRDSARVESTEDTQNILLYMENIQPERKEDHEKAVQMLKDSFKQYLHVDLEDHLITQDHPEVTF